MKKFRKGLKHPRLALLLAVLLIGLTSCLIGPAVIRGTISLASGLRELVQANWALLVVIAILALIHFGIKFMANLKPGRSWRDRC